MLFFIGLQIHWIAMLVSQRFDEFLAPQSSVHELAVSPWSLKAQTPFQTYWIRICILTRQPDDWSALLSLKSALLLDIIASSPRISPCGVGIT